MPRRDKIPKYRKKGTQAVVTLPDGYGGRKDFLLGPFNSAESRKRYDKITGEWIANGRRLVLSKEEKKSLSVNELVLAYWKHANQYYRKAGQVTSEPSTIKQALRFVRRLYGDTPASEFSPLRLKAVRHQMIRHKITRKVNVADEVTGEVRKEKKVLQVGLSRRHINKQIQRIRRMFAWAVEEELVSAVVHTALLCVKGLRKNRSDARERPKVKPVDDAIVDKTLPHLQPVVVAMVQVQRLTGMRPQEIVNLQAGEIAATAAVWEYRPGRHKGEHHDRERIVFIGPRAQQILTTFMHADGYVFSPKRSERQRNASRREKRASPMTPSQAKRKVKSSPARSAGECYAVASYRRAIRRACETAGVPVWYPNQLRHTAGTLIRKTFGLEASQAVLGHAELSVTQVYSEADLAKAREVMQLIG